MTLAEAWQAAYTALVQADANSSTAQLVIEAWSVLTSYLQPNSPQRCSFFDPSTAAFHLDTTAQDAIRHLVQQFQHLPSTSKAALTRSSPILVTLCNNFVGQCQDRFNTVAEEVFGASSGIDAATKMERSALARVLIDVSMWFRAWLSPFSQGGIFEQLSPHASNLHHMLQFRLRKYIDHELVTSIRDFLNNIITLRSREGRMQNADIELLQHLEFTGLTWVALNLLTQVLHAEIERKVKATVEGIDAIDDDLVLALEESARPTLRQWLDMEIKPRFAAIRDTCSASFSSQSRDQSSAQQNELDSQLNQDEFSDEASWESRLDYQLDKALCQIRAVQLFDLIAVYPDSQGALQDLALSLETTDQKLFVAKQLTESLRARLLHPGAHTRDIIQMYVHMVRSLRQVDPSGVVLSRVVSPLRRFLRTRRKDTVPVIVSSMLGDDPHFTLLKDELEAADEEEEAEEARLEGTGDGHQVKQRKKKRRRSLQAHRTSKKSSNGEGRTNRGRERRGGGFSDSDSSDDEDWGDPDWVPKPVEAGRSYRQSTSKDIISMLISIFDDRSSFISALEKSMADQLIKVKGYRAITEYRKNMILKKRFGEKNMGKCDVMLGDITESRRIDNEVHSRLTTSQPSAAGAGGMVSRLHPLVVSRQFWPELNQDASSSSNASGGMASGPQFTLPPLFHMAQEHYGKMYSQAKAMRKLHWLNNLGTVEMEINLEDGRCLSVECSLLQASTLEVISRALHSGTEQAEQQQPSDPHSQAISNNTKIITLTSIMEELNLQQEKDARDALLFWSNVGLLKPLPELADTFAILDAAPDPAE